MPSPTQGNSQTLSSIPAAFQPVPCPVESHSIVHLHSRPTDEPRVAVAPLSA